MNRQPSETENGATLKILTERADALALQLKKKRTKFATYSETAEAKLNEWKNVPLFVNFLSVTTLFVLGPFKPKMAMGLCMLGIYANTFSNNVVFEKKNLVDQLHLASSKYRGLERKTRKLLEVECRDPETDLTSLQAKVETLFEKKAKVDMSIVLLGDSQKYKKE